jgi:hypothetical protein
MQMREYTMKYKDVDADHGGIIKLVLPDVFAFFDSCRINNATVFTKNSKTSSHYSSECSGISHYPQLMKIQLKNTNNFSKVNVSVLDIFGRLRYKGAFSNVKSEILLKEIMLSPGIYKVHIRTTVIDVWADFVVAR